MMLIFNNNNEECENHHEAFGIENRTDASLLYYGLDYLLCRYFCLIFFFPPPFPAVLFAADVVLPVEADPLGVVSIVLHGLKQSRGEPFSFANFPECFWEIRP